MSKPSDAELIVEAACLPDGEFISVNFAKELAQRLKALTEENARLKSPGPCGKHPAACLVLRSVEPTNIERYEACSACESEKAAVEREIDRNNPEVGAGFNHERDRARGSK